MVPDQAGELEDRSVAGAKAQLGDIPKILRLRFWRTRVLLLRDRQQIDGVDHAGAQHHQLGGLVLADIELRL